MKRRFLIPEQVQTNPIDCGAASLKCLLEGYFVPTSYGRLQEAFHNELDGNKLEDIKTMADDMGLQMSLSLQPLEHVFAYMGGELPAIVSIVLPDGSEHFVVLWRKWGSLVQVMDPFTGRRWAKCHDFLDELKVHQVAMSAASWMKKAALDDFVRPLVRRILDLGIRRRQANIWIKNAYESGSWQAIALLDAVIRFAASLKRSGAMKRGQCFVEIIEKLLNAGDDIEIPQRFFTVLPGPSEDRVLVRGVCLLSVTGFAIAENDTEQIKVKKKALHDDKVSERTLVSLLKEDGMLVPSVLLFGFLLEAGLRIIEAVIFRALIDVGTRLSSDQRILGMGIFVLFLVCCVLLLFYLNGSAFKFGRHFEARLRMAFLEKVPKLGVQYFESHPLSDLAERCHNAHVLRTMGYQAGHITRITLSMVTTVFCIIWIDPYSAPLAILTGLLCIYLPWRTRKIMGERDLRVRTHGGSMSRFYLDTLVGLVPCRTHGAELAVRREHEGLLVEWARAGKKLRKFGVQLSGFQQLITLSLTALLVVTHIQREGASSGVLLLLYWAMKIPNAGVNLSNVTLVYISFRNRAMRLLEPIGAPDEASFENSNTTTMRSKVKKSSLEILFEDVSIKIAGETVLKDINVMIDPGSHVAIVGPSGAGKSTLTSVLLGWYQISKGSVYIDGTALSGSKLEKLRREIAWIDPSIQLWNRSFLENLRYGGPIEQPPVGKVVQEADLHGVLEKLADGLQTSVGESGGFLSGGEGQRLRVARGFLRKDARLVILDEAFRGLDRHKRRIMTKRARAWWPEATLICVSHDVTETQAFDRVLVLEDGRIVEDDTPQNLLAKPNSRYGKLIAAEEAVFKSQWDDPIWKRIQLKDGKVVAEDVP